VLGFLSGAAGFADCLVTAVFLLLSLDFLVCEADEGLRVCEDDDLDVD